jgi:Family of unknown function (DUF5336)
MAQPDFRTLPRNDQGVLAAGVLAFIASFFPYYGATVNAAGIHGSSSTSAWHSYATLALILVLAATVLAAVQVFSPGSLPQASMSWNFVVLALSAAGTVLLIIRSFTLDHGDIGGLSYGLRWGAYLLMILCVVQTAFAFLRMRAAGDAMPWAHGGAAPNPPPA